VRQDANIQYHKCFGDKFLKFVPFSSFFLLLSFFFFIFFAETFVSNFWTIFGLCEDFVRIILTIKNHSVLPMLPFLSYFIYESILS
jgi:hypothetical protein